MPDVPHLLIIIGSTRAERRGEPIARWIAELAGGRDDLSSELADLAAYDLPLLSTATPPMSDESRELGAREWSAAVGAADGYLLVVPEYNHGAPAVVKNALDHLFSEWARKPIGFVSYGALGGGVRAVEQLRQVAIELAMVPVRHQVAIPGVWKALDESGVLREPPVAQAHALLDDLVWWADALRDARQASRVGAGR